MMKRVKVKQQSVFRVINLRPRISDHVPRTREMAKGSELGKRHLSVSKCLLFKKCTLTALCGKQVGGGEE